VVNRGDRAFIIGAILVVSLVCQVLSGLLILLGAGGVPPYSLSPGSTPTRMLVVGVIEDENMVLSQGLIRLWHSICCRVIFLALYGH